MFSPKQILCPIDLSPVSSTVMSWANRLAREYRARITILHAKRSLPPMYFTHSQMSQLEEDRKEERRGYLKALTDLADEALDQEIEREVQLVESYPLEAILEWIAVQPQDLIVMGSHGRSGVNRLLLGSVSENVLRQVMCPTLIVRDRPGGKDQPKLSRILCPVNFTDHDRECMEVSCSIAGRFQARLFLVHALEAGEEAPEEVLERLRNRVGAAARESCEITGIVREGNAAEQIIQWAQEHEVDLTVIGALHRPFLEFTTLGTTTERVARHSLSPVLIIPGKRKAG
jgi:nucleotide-binding universal stress UspA family protein